jgi:hypothetical protein
MIEIYYRSPGFLVEKVVSLMSAPRGLNDNPFDLRKNETRFASCVTSDAARRI